MTFQEQLVNHRPSMRLYALLLCKGNMPNAEDLLQESCLKVLEAGNKNQYKENTNFKAFCNTLMRNAFINNYRKKVIRKVPDDSIDYEMLIRISMKDEVSPVHLLIKKELKETMNTIGAIKLEALNLYVIGYTYNGIAEKLKIPIGTVKSRIFLARKQLKQLLNEQA